MVIDFQYWIKMNEFKAGKVEAAVMRKGSQVALPRQSIHLLFVQKTGLAPWSNLRPE